MEESGKLAVAGNRTQDSWQHTRVLGSIPGFSLSSTSESPKLCNTKVLGIIQITLTYLIQVLGVLVVAQCHDKDDLHNVKVGFKESCDRFQRTLCDSRCVIYGPKKALEGEVDSHKGYCVIDCNVDLESFTKDDVNVDDLFKVVMDFSRMIYITLKSRIASLHRLENLKVLRSPYEEGLQEQSQDSRYDNFTNYLTMHTYTICIAL